MSCSCDFHTYTTLVNSLISLQYDCHHWNENILSNVPINHAAGSKKKRRELGWLSQCLSGRCFLSPANIDDESSRIVETGFDVKYQRWAALSSVSWHLTFNKRQNMTLMLILDTMTLINYIIVRFSLSLSQHPSSTSSRFIEPSSILVVGFVARCCCDW